MKKLHSLFLLAALPLALMTSAQAQSSLTAIQSAGVIKIGTEGAYPPFTFHLSPITTRAASWSALMWRLAS